MRNAFAIVTTESTRSASRDGLCGTANFVRIIPAVILSVTNPRRQNAVGRRIAKDEVEKRRNIGLRFAAMRCDDVGRVARHGRTTDLVGHIRTIPSPITPVRFLHAHALLASELSSDAGTVGFVRMISAIVLPVAYFRLEHAALRLPTRKKVIRADSGGAKSGILVTSVRAMTVNTVASESVRYAQPITAFKLVLRTRDVSSIHAPLFPFTILIIRQKPAFPALAIDFPLGCHGALIGTSAIHLQARVHRAIISVGGDSDDSHRLAHEIL